MSPQLKQQEEYHQQRRPRGRSRSTRRSINSAKRRRRHRRYWRSDVDDSSSSDSDNNNNNNNNSDEEEENENNDSRSLKQLHSRKQRVRVESFGVLFVKVGITLLLASGVSYSLFLQNENVQQPLRQNNGSNNNNKNNNMQHHNDLLNLKGSLKNNKRKKMAHHPPKPPSPTTATDFNLEQAESDAYGIADRYNILNSLNVLAENDSTHQQRNNHTTANNSTNNNNNNYQQRVTSFATMAANHRRQFAVLNGGERQARATLQRSLVPVVASQKNNNKITTTTTPTLRRGCGLVDRFVSLLQQASTQQPVAFSIVVLGSSAAAGSGNYFSQSYAFVLEELLVPLFQSSVLQHVQLTVQNWAMEHTTEFPSLWCSTPRNQFDQIPDLIIWDYGITSKPEGLEAFIRNLAGWTNNNDDTNGNPRLPMLIVRDTLVANHNPRRNELLQYYADHNTLVDPLLLHLDQASAPYLHLLDRAGDETNAVPPGFQAWTTSFGGPPGAPGKEHSHLTVQQHNMTAWLISMHLLSALEMTMVQANMETSSASTSAHPPKPPPLQMSRSGYDDLPPPLIFQPPKTELSIFGKEKHPSSSAAWLPLLIGTPKPPSEQSHSYSAPNELQCRSSYITPYAQDTLTELVISGPIEGLGETGSMPKDNTELLKNLLLPKGKQFLTRGWVEDLDKATKIRKQLSKEWEYLGFQEMIKKAYYGSATSGNLTLFIPLSESKSRYARAALKTTSVLPARDYFETVLICEADVPNTVVASTVENNNEDGTCRLYKDSHVHVGDSMATLETISSGVSSSCVFVRIPENAKLASRKDAMDRTAMQELVGIQHQYPTADTTEVDDRDETIGMTLHIRVRSDRGAVKVPCSVAHILWSEAK